MWKVAFLPKAVDEEAKLPPDMQARLGRMLDAIRVGGLIDLPPGWVKPLGHKLWEFRITGKDGIARAIYVTVKERRLVVLHIFIKKTQKTPAREIELALRRSKEIE